MYCHIVKAPSGSWLLKMTPVESTFDSNMLCGTYEILEGCEPDVSMRVKMGQSSDVIALVKADGKFYMTKKEIKVTLGGCGG